METQEKYIRNLYREKLRKKVKTSPSEEMRYLLDLGIQMHREGRREKFEMSNYFRAELRTFTENFFKENDKNYISRLVELNRYARLAILLLIECYRMLVNIYWTLKIQTPFDEGESFAEQKKYFDKVEVRGNLETDIILKKTLEELGSDGAIIKHRMDLEKEIAQANTNPALDKESEDVERLFDEIIKKN